MYGGLFTAIASVVAPNSKLAAQHRMLVKARLKQQRELARLRGQVGVERVTARGERQAARVSAAAAATPLLSTTPLPGDYMPLQTDGAMPFEPALPVPSDGPPPLLIVGGIGAVVLLAAVFAMRNQRRTR